MRSLGTFFFLLCSLCGQLSAQEADSSDLNAAAKAFRAAFQAPQRLMAAGTVISTEAPGYAAPAWADMNGDGKKDLLVGQFKDGKIMIYPNLGEGKLGAGHWLMSDGKTASVPGVW